MKLDKPPATCIIVDSTVCMQVHIICCNFPESMLMHSCQVSWNDRDSPGILAPVLVVPQLMQKRTNVLEFI